MVERLRVLAVGHSYLVALNRGALREVANNSNYQVTVAAPERFVTEWGRMECQPEEIGSALNVVTIPVSCGGLMHLFRYDRDVLCEILVRRQFDVVHIWEEPYIFSGYQVAKAVRLTCPDAALCVQTAQNLAKRYPPPFSMFERYCMTVADGWIACGSLVYENFVAKGYAGEKGIVLPLHVDTSLFRKPKVGELELIRNDLGLAGFVLGYLGRLTPAKGIRILLAALERAQFLSRREWSLLIVGSGPLRGEIERWSRDRGWSERVKIAFAPHAEVPRFLRAMDVLVVPSVSTRGWKEQFGRVVIEAFASGVPVIASNCGELPHVIGDAGWVVPEGDAEALAAAIESALADPDRRAAVARKGLARVNEYSTSTVGGRFAQFYRELVDARRAARAA
jgi:glycosyltransferase involved in cell wall biosynthesis